MEGFFRRGEISLTPALEHAYLASSSIETDDGGRCSGTFITEDGLFITALHCLGGILRAHNLIDEPKLEPRQLKIMNVRDQNPRAAHATGFFLGDHPHLRDPKIEFLGKGVQLVDPVAPVENYEDIALLKFDGHFPAVKLAHTSPQMNEAVWHISKPYAVRSADGNTKYITHGEITEPCCDDCAKPYYLKDRFFSTLDFNNGSSGGGVFNANGELVGINVISLNAPKSYTPGSCGSHSIEALRKFLAAYTNFERRTSLKV